MFTIFIYSTVWLRCSPEASSFTSWFIVGRACVRAILCRGTNVNVFVVGVRLCTINMHTTGRVGNHGPGPTAKLGSARVFRQTFQHEMIRKIRVAYVFLVCVAGRTLYSCLAVHNGHTRRDTT